MQQLEDEMNDDMLNWKGGSDGEPVLGEQLTTIQKRELNILLKEFKKTLQALPGQSNLTEHSIKTDDSGPIRLPAYRIPHAYRGQVEQEIREMLEYDIIQPSKSDWAAPMVIVNKKDGTLRVCVDYRKLNSHSKIDPYPMPRISDFIDQLGEAKYITTLDLTKGYWQVPVKKARQHLLHLLDYLNLKECHLVYRGHQLHSKE